MSDDVFSGGDPLKALAGTREPNITAEFELLNYLRITSGRQPLTKDEFKDRRPDDLQERKSHK